MKKLPTTLGILIAVIFASTPAAAAPGKDGNVQSGWAASVPKIDGKSDDWDGAGFAVWDKGDVLYAFCNDADKLYVLLVFKDPKFLSTARETGVTLYFGPAGKKDKDYSIHFLRRQVPVEEAITLIEREKTLSDEEKTQLRSRPVYAVYDHQVHNKKAKPQPGSAEAGFQPAHFRYASDKEQTVFEFSVLLRRGHELAAGVQASPGDEIMVGFEWGGGTQAQLQGSVRRSGDTSIASEEASRGRIENMSGSRGGNLPPKYSFWTSVRLASAGR